MENKNNRYIVVLEIASSHIAGIVASIADGVSDASVLCYHELPILDCVRYGSIVNVDEVCNKTAELLKRIENERHFSPCNITGVYVAMSGRSLRSETVTQEFTVDDTQTLSQEFLDNVYRKARASFEQDCVLGVVPRMFEINGAEVQNPVGSLGHHLKVSVNVLLCRPQLRRNLSMVFDRLKISIIDFIVTPLALAECLMTEEERRLGAMLVDHGAETTTVSIYKNNRLMYLSVLPIGSRNITRDLVSLNVLEEVAEKIKKTSGNAIATGEDLNGLDIMGVSAYDVSNYITARAGEIMENVYNQLTLAGFTSDQLPAGIMAVGRGMKLKGLKDLLESITKMQVREGRNSNIPAASNLINVPQLLAVLDYITREPQKIVNCIQRVEQPVIAPEQVAAAVQEEERPAEKKKKKKGIFTRFLDRFNDITNETEDEFAEDEENNKRR